MNNPYQPLEHSAEPPPRAKFLRWRVLPVTFFAIVTFLVILATAFDFMVLGYSAMATSTPEGWQQKHGFTFLRDGLIGILQIPLFGVGTYWLWKERYLHAAFLLVPAFFVRTVAVFFFPS